MNGLSFIYANMRFRPLTAFFNILILAVGIALILTLAHLDREIGDRFTRDLKGIDLVVSGKGSPLQIILSSVFHLDIPTGNISADEADQLSKNPLVKAVVPLALGDNYKGFRIVGTTPGYLSHYKADLLQGNIWTGEMQAVLGATAAKESGLHIGDTFSGSHGLAVGGESHTEFPYTVTGVLKPTGRVIDRLVLTGIESVWHIHGHHHHEDENAEEEEEHGHEEKEYTALLLTYASPMAAVSLPRQINTTTHMQAASPAFEMARLTKLMGMGSDILSAFGALLLVFSALGFFVTLSNAINERIYDIALLRVLGASKWRVFSLLLGESLVLGSVGVMLGFILSRVSLLTASMYIGETRHINLQPFSLDAIDAWTATAALALCLVAGMIPAMRTYRINIAKILAQA